MTFYEAALRVLEGAGRPLHFQEITERSIAGNLLSHVGKTPEQTMLSRLLAMARRPRDRRVLVTEKDTFALVEWALPENPQALAETAAQQENPEEALPPYRPAERHPEPRQENVRASGRGASGKRRGEDDEPRKKRKFPPIPEVVFEILSDAGEPLPPPELAERARSKELASSELSTEQILTSLLEDNQRRIDVGRRPQFIFKDGEISLERAGAPSEAPPVELQAAFAAALGIPMEGGRPVFPRSSSQQRAAEAALDPQAFATAKTAVREARRAASRALRQKLADLEPGTFEKSVVRMMQALGFRELKVAKRAKEGPLVTARKREGSLELRYAVRVLKGGGAVERRSVQELRRDLHHHSAHVGIVVASGDVRGDARSEATGQGALVLLWAGEGLADKFLEAKAGVKVTTVELYEADERFFEEARVDAEEAARRREERKEQRQRDERGGGGGRRERPERNGEAELLAGAEDAGDEEPETPARRAREDDAPREERSAGADAEGGEDDEGDEDLDAASAFAGEGAEGGAPNAEGGAGTGRRRRRRRRGRRGRGAAAGEGAPSGEGGAAGAPAGDLNVAAEAPPPPPPSVPTESGAE